MRVEVLMYGQKEGEAPKPVVPLPVYRMIESMAQTIAIIMRAFSISKVHLDIINSGPVPTSVIKFKCLDDQYLPQDIMDIRLDILRGVLKTVCERFGLATITLVLTEAEIDELRQYWKFLATGTAKGAATPLNPKSNIQAGFDAPITFMNIKLPYEADPGPMTSADTQHD